MANDVPTWEDTEEIVAEGPSWEETEEVATTPGISKTESALRGAGQGLTAGYQDELSAGTEPILAWLDRRTADILGKGLISGESSERLEELGKREYGEGSYDKRVEEYRGMNTAAKEANPWSYGLGEVGGSLVTTAAGGGALGKVAQGAGKAAQVAKGAQTVAKANPWKAGIGLGAVGGGVQAGGLSEAKDVGELARDVAGGVALGAGAGVLGTGLSKVANKFMRPAKEAAEEATGGLKVAARESTEGALEQGTKQADELLDEATEQGSVSLAKKLNPVDDIEGLSPAAKWTRTKQGVESAKASGIPGSYFKGNKEQYSRFGRELQKLGIVQAGDVADDVAAKAERMMTDRGKTIANQIANYDDLIASKAAGRNRGVEHFNFMDFFEDVDDKVLKEFQGINEREGAVVRKFLNEIKNKVEEGGQVTLSELQKQKQRVGNMAYKLGAEKLPISKKLLQKYERVLNSHIENTLEKAAQTAPDAVDYAAYKAAKQDYSTAAQAYIGASKKAGRDLNQDLISMGDVIAGTVWGAMTDSLLFGIGTGVARGFIRPRFPSLAAGAFNKLGNVLSKEPSKFGRYAGVLTKAAQRGKPSLAATHYVLSQQYPDYRQNIEGILEESEDER